MSFDPLLPYGPLIESTVRVVTWNVWGNFGPWEKRYEAITTELAELLPDIICLHEVWRNDSYDVAGSIADSLSMRAALALDWFEPLQMSSGTALLSRWPIVEAIHRVIAPGADGGDGALFAHARVDGPRGQLDVFGVMVDWRLDLSDVRQRQVRELASFIGEHSSRRNPTIVCGDFNAAPDSDELRMLTGLSQVIEPGLVFYDAWAMAGDGTSGHTWSNDNCWAQPALFPDRRVDYVLSAWPRRGGAGHPVHCELAGTKSDPPASDHYAVVADLRY